MHQLRVVFKSGHVESFVAKNWTMVGTGSRAQVKWEGIVGRRPWMLEMDDVVCMTIDEMADESINAHAPGDAAEPQR